MTHVAVDDKATAALSQAADLVAVHDAQGKTIGYFAPVASRDELLRRHMVASVDPTKLRRRDDRSEKTYTTAEVKEFLRSLEKNQ